MAEIAGLTFGVFGLAGLIGVFKDTIDLFDLLANTRHLGRQYAILDTKLDIEKTLLLQWADRVKLLNTTDYDRRLDDAETYRIVVRILDSIGYLLTDTNNLQQRYGLKDGPDVRPVPAQHAESSLRDDLIAAGLPQELFTADLPSDVRHSEQPRDKSRLASRRGLLSQMRMNRFDQEFEARSFDKKQEKSFSISQKVRWVVGDKQKFENLISDLAHFISKLNEVLPLAQDDVASGDAMIRSDLSLIKEDVGRLSIILEASVGLRDAHQIAESTQKAIDKTRQNRILNRLWFRKINDRKDSIKPRHNKTFRWALEPPGDGNSWDDLPAWLSHGSGIYWISGKAGSGKSTLMKYLYYQELTRVHLLQWANGGPFVLCHYFFSNLGSDEQKTQEGLSRTLLHQILDGNPWLIQDALPGMWREVVENESKEGRQSLRTAQDTEIALPSTAEARHAFDIIAANASAIGRCCFFIDGLDEFVGDYNNGIAFFQSLAKSDHVKIILSSRPIPSCVAAFGTLPHLRLQDLTRSDIHFYVDDIIGNHPTMMGHMRRYPEGSAALLGEIVQKSCGVFLWVILACRSILSGFADHDRLVELRRRVDELPPELESMFTHMLGKIDRRHQQQGAQLFRICHTYQGTESPFLRKDLSALGLALVDGYHISPSEMKDFTQDDKAEMCHELEGRLRSRCGGLLEFATVNPAIDSTPKVVFMHRTVFEFLSNEDVWKLDCLQIPDDRFDSFTALSLYGVHMATQMLYAKHDIQAMDYLEEGLWWGAEADSRRPGDVYSCFFHLDPFLQALHDVELRTATLRRLLQATTHGATHSGPPVTLLLAVEAGAANWVRQNPRIQALSRNCHGPSRCESCKPLLYHALRKQFVSAKFNDQPFQGTFPSAKMIQTLLSCGCDATGTVETDMGEVSLWSLWLENVHDLVGNKVDALDARGKAIILAVAGEFVEAGALAHPDGLGTDGISQLVRGHFQS